MRIAMVSLVCMLSACATSDAPSERPPAFKTCTDAAAYYKDRVGGPLSEPPTFTPHRVIPPNFAVTMDYNPNRLNVYTDDKGVITDARCG